MVPDSVSEVIACGRGGANAATSDLSRRDVPFVCSNVIEITRSNLAPIFFDRETRGTALALHVAPVLFTLCCSCCYSFSCFFVFFFSLFFHCFENAAREQHYRWWICFSEIESRLASLRFSRHTHVRTYARTYVHRTN